MNTNLFHFQTLKFPKPLCHASPRISTPRRSSMAKLSNSSQTTIPGRDTVIDFGKHKGKPLGTLPSKYLRWVSENLRARDFEHWAKLADEVLADPVYQDRVEWEFAQSILGGERAGFRAEPVAELLEISQRFGWDNDDKAGWSRVDFELLGTSKSGRIPRRSPERRDEATVESRREKAEEKLPENGREKRRERRREAKLGDKSRGSLGNSEKTGGSFGNSEKGRGSLGNSEKVYNPFPGREGLIKDVLRGRRFL